MRDFDKIKEKEKGDEFKGMLAIGMIFLVALGVIVYILINLTNQYFNLKTKLEDSGDTIRIVTTNPEDGASFEYNLDKSVIKVEKIRKEIEKTSTLNFDKDDASSEIKKIDDNKKTVANKNIVKKSDKEKVHVKKDVKKKKSDLKKNKKVANKKVVQPVKQVATSSIKPDKNFRYVVQLMAFKTRKEADSKFNKIKSDFKGLYIVKVNLGKKGTWYRLRCCGSGSYSAAKKKVKEIEKKYSYRPIVVKTGK